MGLSSRLVSEFVKITSDNSSVVKDNIVYGTATVSGGSTYVKLDGSDLLTPIRTTVDVKNGERVTVMVKDHTATITGNLASPSARTDDVQAIAEDVEKITEAAEKITDIETQLGKIDILESDNVIIKESLTSVEANISNLQADNVTINNTLIAANADIEDLKDSYLAYNRTYSSAANMYVTPNGVFGRSTSSSERYERDISVSGISELSGLYELPVKKFKYNNDYISSNDELYDKYLYGFSAEDLENILPCAVQHITDEDGNSLPEMWNVNIIVPALLKLIQDLNNRITDLENIQFEYDSETGDLYIVTKEMA